MTDPTAYLLGELSALQAENKYLRRRLKASESRVAYWRTEAQVWKWGSLHGFGRSSTVPTDLSPTERAEESGVA